MMPQSSEASHSKKSHTLTIVLFMLVVVCAGFGVYSFYAWRKAVATNPATIQNNIIEAVSSIAITPSETPQVATVKDASKLTGGTLARVAKNGDVLLIYSKANQIFVYRPSAHKLVDILSVQAPVNASTSPDNTQSSQKK